MPVPLIAVMDFRMLRIPPRFVMTALHVYPAIIINMPAIAAKTAGIATLYKKECVPNIFATRQFIHILSARTAVPEQSSPAKAAIPTIMAMKTVLKGGHYLRENVCLMIAAVFLFKASLMKQQGLSARKSAGPAMTTTINMLPATKAGKWPKANAICAFAIMPFILIRNARLTLTVTFVFREMKLNMPSPAVIPVMNLKTEFVLKAVNIPVPARQVIVPLHSAV